MPRTSFVLHNDSLKVLEELTNDQAGQLFKAIAAYQLTGQLPPLDFGIKMAVLPFIAQFERDTAKYEAVCERNRANGRGGGRPTEPKETQQNPNNPVGFLATHNNPEEPKKPDSDSDNKNDSDSDTTNVVVKKNGYKKMSQDEFLSDVESFQEYPAPMRKEFYDYWRERAPDGRMLFQTQKTWETNLRLARWFRNNKQKYKINGTTETNQPFPAYTGKNAGVNDALASLARAVTANGTGNSNHSG